MNVHANDKIEEKFKPFKCNLCGETETFSQPNILTKHFEKQHAIIDQE